MTIYKRIKKLKSWIAHCENKIKHNVWGDNTHWENYIKEAKEAIIKLEEEHEKDKTIK